MVAARQNLEVSVRIDLGRFIANAMQAGVRLTTNEAAAFLQEWGFEYQGDGFWRCPADRLDVLHDDEIGEVVPG